MQLKYLVQDDVDLCKMLISRQEKVWANIFMAIDREVCFLQYFVYAFHKTYFEERMYNLTHYHTIPHF